MLWVTSGQFVRTKYLTAKEINSPLVLGCLSVNYQNVPSVGRLIIKVAPFFGIMQSLVWVLSWQVEDRVEFSPHRLLGWVPLCRVKPQVWVLWPYTHPKSDSQGPGIHFVTTDSKLYTLEQSGIVFCFCQSQLKKSWIFWTPPSEKKWWLFSFSEIALPVSHIGQSQCKRH